MSCIIIAQKQKKLIRLLFCCSLLLNVPVFAQYTGGEGDGYARATTSQTITSTMPTELSAPPIVLLPNIVQVGEKMKLQINDEQAINTHWNIFTTNGQLISEQVIFKGQVNYIHITNLRSGVYFLAPTASTEYAPIIFTILD